VPGPQLRHLAALIEAQRLLEFDPAGNFNAEAELGRRRARGSPVGGGPVGIWRPGHRRDRAGYCKCGGRDSNPHGRTTTRLTAGRVYPSSSRWIRRSSQIVGLCLAPLTAPPRVCHDGAAASPRERTGDPLRDRRASSLRKRERLVAPRDLAAGERPTRERGHRRRSGGGPSRRIGRWREMPVHARDQAAVTPARVKPIIDRPLPLMVLI
jgi:hypothetical protein